MNSLPMNCAGASCGSYEVTVFAMKRVSFLRAYPAIEVTGIAR